MFLKIILYLSLSAILHGLAPWNPSSYQNPYQQPNLSAPSIYASPQNSFQGNAYNQMPMAANPLPQSLPSLPFASVYSNSPQNYGSNFGAPVYGMPQSYSNQGFSQPYNLNQALYGIPQIDPLLLGTGYNQPTISSQPVTGFPVYNQNFLPANPLDPNYNNNLAAYYANKQQPSHLNSYALPPADVNSQFKPNLTNQNSYGANTTFNNPLSNLSQVSGDLKHLQFQLPEPNSLVFKLNYFFGDDVTKFKSGSFTIEPATESLVINLIDRIQTLSEKVDDSSFFNQVSGKLSNVVSVNLELAGILLLLNYWLNQFPKNSSEHKNIAQAIAPGIAKILAYSTDKAEDTSVFGEGTIFVDESGLNENREAERILLAFNSRLILDNPDLLLALNSEKPAVKDIAPYDVTNMEQESFDAVNDISGRILTLSGLAMTPALEVFVPFKGDLKSDKSPFLYLLKTDGKELLKLTKSLSEIRNILISKNKGQYLKVAGDIQELFVSFKKVLQQSNIENLLINYLNVDQTKTMKDRSIDLFDLKIESKDITSHLYVSEVYTAFIWSLARFLSIMIEITAFKRSVKGTSFTPEELNTLSALIEFVSSKELFLVFGYNIAASKRSSLTPNVGLKNFLAKIIIKAFDMLGNAVEKSLNKGASVGIQLLQKVVVTGLDESVWLWPETSDAVTGSLGTVQAKFIDLIKKDFLGNINTGTFKSKVASLRKTLSSETVKDDLASKQAAISIIEKLKKCVWKESVFKLQWKEIEDAYSDLKASVSTGRI